MDYLSPLKKSKDDYQDIINKIGADSSVGIDAPYTHAIIIDYLQQLTGRIERIESLIEEKNK